jgi:hypothetical protein
MALPTQTLQKTHSFSLVYSGIDDFTQQWLDALYDSGCDDATVGLQNGLVFMDFHRQAPTFQMALTSAIENVEKSRIPIRLVRVEPI